MEQDLILFHFLCFYTRLGTQIPEFRSRLHTSVLAAVDSTLFCSHNLQFLSL